MQYVTEYDVTNISDTRPRKNMITIGKVDASDLMMIITWAIDISFQLPELKWVSWTHTTPHILMTKVIERTSSMLDTPPQDKLYRRLQVFNACEHSWIMMIMGGSKMSKNEYDLKAICILRKTYMMFIVIFICQINDVFWHVCTDIFYDNSLYHKLSGKNMCCLFSLMDVTFSTTIRKDQIRPSLISKNMHIVQNCLFKEY